MKIKFKFMIIFFVVFSFFIVNVSAQECTFSDAYWAIEESRIDSGTVLEGGINVFLVVEGTDCEGETVNFEIFEDDMPPWPNTPAQVNPSPATFGEFAAIAVWTTEWIEDGSLSGNPEYFFVASLGSDPEIEWNGEGSEEIEVIQPTGSECESKDDCPSGYVCSSDGECLEIIECEIDSDCGVGEECEDGVCQFIETDYTIGDGVCDWELDEPRSSPDCPTCIVNDECEDSEGEVWQNCRWDCPCNNDGVCEEDKGETEANCDVDEGGDCPDEDIPTPSGCITSVDCDDDEECVNGQCVPIVIETCNYNSDCNHLEPPEHVCIDGLCTPEQDGVCELELESPQWVNPYNTEEVWYTLNYALRNTVALYVEVNLDDPDCSTISPKIDFEIYKTQFTGEQPTKIKNVGLKQFPGRPAFAGSTWNVDGWKDQDPETVEPENPSYYFVAYPSGKDAFDESAVYSNNLVITYDPTEVECNEQHTCPSGFYCDEFNTCAPEVEAECFDDTDCGVGEECDEFNNCVLKEEDGCYPPCEPGEYCDEFNNCVPEEESPEISGIDKVIICGGGQLDISIGDCNWVTGSLEGAGSGAYCEGGYYARSIAIDNINEPVQEGIDIQVECCSIIAQC